MVLPGFVDPHTHLVFAGSRPREFEARLTQGRSFTDFIKEGGGAMDTVRRTRAASDEELADLLMLRLRRIAQWGVTTVEVKTGYGLSIEEELRHLRVLAGRGGPVAGVGGGDRAAGPLPAARRSGRRGRRTSTGSAPR